MYNNKVMIASACLIIFIVDSNINIHVVRQCTETSYKMKHWTYILLSAIVSCNNLEQKASGSGTLASVTPSSLKETQTQNNSEVCWTGTLNNKTPVFIHYKPDSNLIIGY